jgi:hypothetical protein
MIQIRFLANVSDVNATFLGRRLTSIMASDASWLGMIGMGHRNSG